VFVYYSLVVMSTLNEISIPSEMDFTQIRPNEKGLFFLYIRNRLFLIKRSKYYESDEQSRRSANSDIEREVCHLIQIRSKRDLDNPKPFIDSYINSYNRAIRSELYTPGDFPIMIVSRYGTKRMLELLVQKGIYITNRRHGKNNAYPLATVISDFNPSYWTDDCLKERFDVLKYLFHCSFTMKRFNWKKKLRLDLIIDALNKEFYYHGEDEFPKPPDGNNSFIERYPYRYNLRFIALKMQKFIAILLHQICLRRRWALCGKDVNMHIASFLFSD
jgi:hypothetical protein